ncbi:MAG: hypothetical protein EKK41_16150 [Hyphomicrobiales bacterium]|nr:MAG: hypothetical protein EKK41_16150 [Hyphomicrobiales bacterium]
MLDELRPGARAEPELAWPAYPTTDAYANGTSAPTNGHGSYHAAAADIAPDSQAIIVPPLAALEPHLPDFEKVAEAANNNTGPADQSSAAPEPAQEIQSAVPAQTSGNLLLAGPEVSSDQPEAATDPTGKAADSGIDVDEISGWFSRPRRKA